MPRRVKDWVEGYVKYTDNTEPRETFRRWSAIMAIASCLRRKCYLPWGMETFHTNLYTVLVGPPASRKGTAIRPMREMLEAIGITMAADESSKQKLIHRMRSTTTPMVTGDKHFIYSSLTIISTELTVFLRQKDTELLSYLCKWYDCEKRFEYDTYARGPEDVTNVWCNLYGATTPALLQSSLPESAEGSGFISRTIFVFEEDKRGYIIYPALSDEQKKLEIDLLVDLEQIGTLSGTFGWDDEFMSTYAKWREEAERHPPFQQRFLLAYNDRRPTHLFKLSMAFCVSRGDELILRKVDIERAIELQKQTERKMPQVFAGIGLNPFAEVQQRVMEVIRKRGRIEATELIGMFYADVSDTQLAEILTTLEKMKYCKIHLEDNTIEYMGGK